MNLTKVISPRGSWRRSRSPMSRLICRSQSSLTAFPQGRSRSEKVRNVSQESHLPAALSQDGRRPPTTTTTTDCCRRLPLLYYYYPYHPPPILFLPIIPTNAFCKVTGWTDLDGPLPAFVTSQHYLTCMNHPVPTPPSPTHTFRQNFSKSTRDVGEIGTAQKTQRPWGR